MSADRTWQRLRDANPYPIAEIEREAAAADALLAHIEETSRTMTDTRPWSLPAISAGVGIVAVLALALFVVRPGFSGADPEDVASVATAISGGDLETTLALVSPESNCDVPIGTQAETCEQFFGFAVGIGAQIDYACPVGERPSGAAEPFACTMSMPSDVHDVMGYPDFVIRDRVQLELDGDGRLVIDNSTMELRTFVPEPGGAALWSVMRTQYPDLNWDVVSGPDPYDQVAGDALLETARTFNSPTRIVPALESSLRAFSPGVARQCVTQDGTYSCRNLVGFLEAIGAVIELDCDPASAADGVILCAMLFDSDMHAALGSGPTDSEASVEYRGGTVARLELELHFTTDELTAEALLDAAHDDPALFDGSRPNFTSESGPAWVEAAIGFSQ